MNVLVVCDSGLYSDFGISFVHAQVAAYAALGHRVRVIVPYAVGKRDWDGNRFSGPVRRWVRDGAEIYTMRYLSLSNYGKKRFNTASALWTLPKRLDKLLEGGFIPDVIHAHTLGFDSEIGAFLKERLGLPLVVTTHGSDTTIPMKLGWYEQVRHLCDKVDVIVAVSSVLRNRLLPCGTETPVVTILNGFRLKNLPEGKTERGCSLIQVGRLNEQKRAHITIQALSQLRKERPEVILTLVGDGPERSVLENLCQDLGVLESIRFTGQVPNARALEEMAKAQFFVLPSVDEGFGIVYLEAMACGCVAIGTEGEGIADLIVSGKNGFLIPPDDPEAIVQTVEWCLSHPEETAAVAERGRRDALSLTWKQNAEQYFTLFEELIR